MLFVTSCCKSVPYFNFDWHSQATLLLPDCSDARDRLEHIIERSHFCWCIFMLKFDIFTLMKSQNEQLEEDGNAAGMIDYSLVK